MARTSARAAVIGAASFLGGGNNRFDHSDFAAVRSFRSVECSAVRSWRAMSSLRVPRYFMVGGGRDVFSGYMISTDE
jgi:hypothetical protein